MDQKAIVPAPYFDFAALSDEMALLAEEHAGKETALRAALVDRFKSLMQEAHAQAERQLNADGDGVKCAEGISDFQDALIRLSYEVATRYVYRVDNPSSSERMAIVATGGYGRGRLAPGSDIDIMFLLPHKQTAWGESVAEFMLYLLWDLGLKVGHATRSIDHCVRLAHSDMTIRTALLDARLILGDEDSRRKNLFSSSSLSLFFWSFLDQKKIRTNHFKAASKKKKKVKNLKNKSKKEQKKEK